MTSTIHGRFRRNNGEYVSEAQYLLNPYMDEIPRWERAWGVHNLRFVAEALTKKLYIFPNWLLHSDFLLTQLHLEYEDVMDGIEVFFGIIQIHENGIPYAVIESSQIQNLIKNHNVRTVTEALKKLQKEYEWLSLYGIEPVKALFHKQEK